jgi:hypothetical protein
MPVFVGEMARNMVHCRSRQGYKEAAKQRWKPQASRGPIRERVIGRADRAGNLASDQANDHVAGRNDKRRKKERRLVCALCQ